MFKQRKHKTFSYQPKFSKEGEGNSNGEALGKKDFVSAWKRGNKRKTRGAMPMRTLILILVLLLICMYLLEKKYM